jgi:hypothetical protein
MQCNLLSKIAKICSGRNHHPRQIVLLGKATMGLFPHFLPRAHSRPSPELGSETQDPRSHLQLCCTASFTEGCRVFSLRCFQLSPGPHRSLDYRHSPNPVFAVSTPDFGIQDSRENMFDCANDFFSCGYNGGCIRRFREAQVFHQQLSRARHCRRSHRERSYSPVSRMGQPWTPELRVLTSGLLVFGAAVLHGRYEATEAERKAKFENGNSGRKSQKTQELLKKG